MQHRIDFDELEWKSPIEGVRDKSVVQDGRRVRLVEYSRSMPPHWCEKGHFGYVLEGEMEVEYPGETVVYKEGHGILIPSGCEHRHRARILTERALVFFIEEE
ncbi:MAG: cupin domain-containing protein [Candidatus Eisenbacteria bacterium]